MAKNLKNEKVVPLFCIVVLFAVTLFRLLNGLYPFWSGQAQYFPFIELFRTFVVVGGLTAFYFKKKLGWHVVTAYHVYTIVSFLIFSLSHWYIEGLYWRHTAHGFINVFIDLFKLEWPAFVALYILMRAEVKNTFFPKGSVELSEYFQTLAWAGLLKTVEICSVYLY